MMGMQLILRLQLVWLFKLFLLMSHGLNIYERLFVLTLKNSELCFLAFISPQILQMLNIHICNYGSLLFLPLLVLLGLGTLVDMVLLYRIYTLTLDIPRIWTSSTSTSVSAPPSSGLLASMNAPSLYVSPVRYRIRRLRLIARFFSSFYLFIVSFTFSVAKIITGIIIHNSVQSAHIFPAKFGNIKNAVANMNIVKA